MVAADWILRLVFVHLIVTMPGYGKHPTTIDGRKRLLAEQG